MGASPAPLSMFVYGINNLAASPADVDYESIDPTRVGLLCIVDTNRYHCLIMISTGTQRHLAAIEYRYSSDENDNEIDRRRN